MRRFYAVDIQASTYLVTLSQSEGDYTSLPCVLLHNQLLSLTSDLLFPPCLSTLCFCY